MPLGIHRTDYAAGNELHGLIVSAPFTGARGTYRSRWALLFCSRHCLGSTAKRPFLIASGMYDHVLSQQAMPSGPHCFAIQLARPLNAAISQPNK
ncbi:hypothetical protein J6590_066706 [Homalodisca vitripennis]|nr:hypothetical protein J6590_066706 [Homalodisca vitripennis]